MATRFELVMYGDDTGSLRAAGEEAIAEIERLEDQLSLYRDSSEISAVNARSAHMPVRVSAPVFELLQQAKRLYQESGGSFDITIAPLVRCWGFMGGGGRIPGDEVLAEARACVGMHLVQLEPKDQTVQFEREGVMLDLGAIGKGYAIERAAELLRDAGVTSALLHGGTSSVYAVGHPPDAVGWKVAIEKPPASMQMDSFQIEPQLLKDEAMSVSAIWGRYFQNEGNMFGHVLDPRTGRPAKGAVLAAVRLPSATETDALSTALLIRGSEGHEPLKRLRPAMKTLLIVDDAGTFRVESKGFLP